MIEEGLHKHPEILIEEINSPVVIVGLPRTGSTMTPQDFLPLIQTILQCYGGREDIQQC
jgi:hypothetical protein